METEDVKWLDWLAQHWRIPFKGSANANDILVGGHSYRMDRTFRAEKAYWFMGSVAVAAHYCDWAHVDESIRANPEMTSRILLDELPFILSQARPLISRTCAIAIIPNREFEDLKRDPISLGSRITDMQLLVLCELDLAQVLMIGSLALRAVGLRRMKKTLPGMLSELSANYDRQNQ